VSEEPGQKKSILIGLRVILIASLLLFLLATLTEVYKSPSPSSIESAPTLASVHDDKIIPGTRIGPVTLGLKTSQLVTLLGKGQLRPHDQGIMHLYENLGIVIYAENEQVVSVTVRTPVFKTRNGVRVGSDVDAVLNMPGADYEMSGNPQSYVLHDWDSGLHAGIENEKVVYLQVTPGMGAGPSKESNP